MFDNTVGAKNLFKVIEVFYDFNNKVDPHIAGIHINCHSIEEPVCKTCYEGEGLGVHELLTLFRTPVWIYKGRKYTMPHPPTITKDLIGKRFWVRNTENGDLMFVSLEHQIVLPGSVKMEKNNAEPE